jgi:hypothetical protein
MTHHLLSGTGSDWLVVSSSELGTFGSDGFVLVPCLIVFLRMKNFLTASLYRRFAACWEQLLPCKTISSIVKNHDLGVTAAEEI